MKTQNYHKVCLICGSTKLISLKKYKSAYLCKCKDCEFVFSKKIPSDIELENHYKNYERNDYLSPITIIRYHELLDKFEAYRTFGNLLDVGCGIGYFLAEAKKRGWNVYGTEYTDEAVRICEKSGISMQKGKLNPNNYLPGMFDVITSFEVIEHINNPNEELRNFAKIIRKGGVVYCTTPNFNSLLRYRLKSAYNVICYPEHLSYYSPKTLKKVFNSAGFSTIKIETTGFSITRLTTSKGTSDQEYISKNSDDEQIRNKLESNYMLKKIKIIINTFLTIMGTGDSLKGLFINK